MDYNAPSGSTDPNAGYVGKTVSTLGSKVPPKAVEFTQREIVNAEKCAGLTPSNGDTTQLAQAAALGIWLGTLGASPNALAGTVGGGANASAPGILKTLNTWTRLRGIALQTNTATTVTFAVTGVGSSTSTVQGNLYRRDGSALAVGDIPVGVPFDVQPDGTGAFRMTGEVMSDRLAATLIATATTKTVYGAGADFANLAAAFAWLAPRRIIPGASVTFQLGAGQWVHDQASNAVLIQHPDLNRVSIIGATLTNGGFPAYANMAMTGSSSAQRTADFTNNLATARARFPTELRFTGAATLQAIGTLAMLQDVLITGDQSAVSGLSLTAGTQTLNRVVIANFGVHGLFTRNCLTIVQGGLWCFGNVGSGVYVGASSTINYTTGSIYALGNGRNGFTVNEGSTITTDATGVSLVGSGNATYGGVALYNSALLSGAAGSFSSNGSHGVAALSHASVLAGSASCANNGGYGFYSGQTSFVTATGSTTSGNTSGAYGANQGSFIDATGYGGTGTFSPAANTSGNGNSYIQA